jgi:hypothetical protein
MNEKKAPRAAEAKRAEQWFKNIPGAEAIPPEA